ELRLILRNSGIPTIYVTHDQEEAFSISDRLILLNEGEIVQTGSPDEIHSHPISPWVANFLGLGNLVPGEVISISPFRVRTPIGNFEGLPPENKSGLKIGCDVILLFRPDGVSLTQIEGGDNHLSGVVEDTFFRGDGYGVNLRCVNGYLFLLNAKQAIPVGEKVKLYITLQSIQSF
ncbi:MAG: TOBE domain-containing protein, partial [Anaerolineaceae bacterium]|nr:TOBE domain-containing protein [Anaerolineaceae bacterium]